MIDDVLLFLFPLVLTFLKSFIVMYFILKGTGMEEVKSYCFEEKEFNKIEKLADSIYNISVVLDYFCSTQREIEELYNLTPIVKKLREKSDILNTIFINFDVEEI